MQECLHEDEGVEERNRCLVKRDGAETNGAEVQGGTEMLRKP